MIFLRAARLDSVEDAWAALQQAIGIEFATLPPYLYAKFSIRPGTNVGAADNLGEIVGQEMIHFCLGCNILNALGGNPRLKPPVYPGTIPGDIGPPGGKPLPVSLLPFSKEAMDQGMAIERPVDPPDFPVMGLVAGAPTGAQTIGQFYGKLDAFLKGLKASAWKAGRNQIDDNQFFAGQLFAVNNYDDAHRAIGEIVSEGEGAANDPLDFQGEVAHYYRFGEIRKEKVLTKADNPLGYTWGPAKFAVDWTTATGVYPAIKDPGSHDFSKDPPAARAAQAACNLAYSRLVDALQRAVTGEAAQLGVAVRAMFDLRTAAMTALATPLADGKSVAGPSFLYKSTKAGASA